MNDTTPQTAEGKVLWHFTMSLDGFVAGPNHAMDWMAGTNRPGLEDEYVTTTGAVLGGRTGWDIAAASGGRPYGGDWAGPIFVLTHHPEDAPPADGATFLDCGHAQAVRLGLEAANGKNLEVLSPTVGTQLLGLGLIDEIDLHIAPVLLGDGIRLYHNPGSTPIHLHRAGDANPNSEINLRYRPTTTAKAPDRATPPSSSGSTPRTPGSTRAGRWSHSSSHTSRAGPIVAFKPRISRPRWLLPRMQAGAPAPASSNSGDHLHHDNNEALPHPRPQLRHPPPSLATLIDQLTQHQPNTITGRTRYLFLASSPNRPLLSGSLGEHRRHNLTNGAAHHRQSMARLRQIPTNEYRHDEICHSTNRLS